MPSLIAAAIGASVVGGVASAVIGSQSASKAGKVQARAAASAAAASKAQYEQTRADLAPFRQAGINSLTQLQKLTGTDVGGNPLTSPLTKPFNPTMADLEATPGYQFTLAEGLKSTQNSYAAKGLGQSGAALKGAAQYSTNLASTTFQQQFDNYLKQNNQIYGMLSGQVSLGENAAAQTGNFGQAAVNAQNNLTTSGAAAQAAGIVGSGNALIGGINSISNSIGNFAQLQSLKNAGLFGTATGAAGISFLP